MTSNPIDEPIPYVPVDKGGDDYDIHISMRSGQVEVTVNGSTTRNLTVVELTASPDGYRMSLNKLNKNARQRMERMVGMTKDEPLIEGLGGYR